MYKDLCEGRLMAWLVRIKVLAPGHSSHSFYFRRFWRSKDFRKVCNSHAFLGHNRPDSILATPFPMSRSLSSLRISSIPGGNSYCLEELAELVLKIVDLRVQAPRPIRNGIWWRTVSLSLGTSAMETTPEISPSGKTETPAGISRTYPVH